MVFSTRASTSASTATLVDTAIATGPMLSATRLAPSASRSATTTALAPSSANRRHSAEPMPPAAPVTTQTLSRSSMPGMLRVGCRQFLERLLDQRPQQRSVIDGRAVDVEADVHAAPVGQDGGVEGSAAGRAEWVVGQHRGAGH